ncbi:MAG: PilZ domain-containing protein [Anaerolineaceae bacterium]|nr:PilZ domain-containing protein [Anaerolineaceae bacterium]
MKVIEKDILEKFHIIRNSDNEMRFLNMYQGLPISHVGKIIDIHEEEVRFHVSKYQGLCLQLELSTILMHDVLQNKIQAKPVIVDLRMEEVTLGSLKYYPTTIDSRQQIRVETNKPIKAILENYSEVDAKITEISKTGIGLSMNRRDYNAKFFGKGKPVKIHFKLPVDNKSTQHTLVTEGIVRNIKPMNNDFYFRLGIESFPRPSVEQVIEKYIMVRQEEIFFEMNRLCDLNISSIIG